MSHKEHATEIAGTSAQSINTDFGEAKLTKLQQGLEERKTSEILQFLKMKFQETIAKDSRGKS